MVRNATDIVENVYSAALREGEVEIVEHAPNHADKNITLKQ